MLGTILSTKHTPIHESPLDTKREGDGLAEKEQDIPRNKGVWIQDP
tara:strand:+ start:334 stop:471 length:138 start_codon:yes stop_codon:yes gene_type:complete